MSELVRFLSGDNDVAQKTQMDPQNPTAKFVPLEPGQVLFGLEVVEDGSLLGTIYYDYKDKNGIITRVSMGNGGAGGSGGGGGIIKTLATTDGKHESDEVTATANTIIPLPKKIFANLLSAKTQFNFPKVHDPSNAAYVNEDAAPGQSYLYGNGLHMVNPFNTLQDSWIRTIGKSGSAEATLELAMRDNASNEYIYDQIVARHYKADGTIVTDTDGHKREVVILGKEGESQFPGPVTSQRGFVGDVDGNAKSATKAKQDWYDQVIDSTYLSKIVKTTHNGSKFEITSYDGRYTPVGSADAKKDVITIPGATTTLAGLVTTGDQTITGNKTINSSGTLTIIKQGGFIYSGIQEDKATDKNLPIWFSTGTANGTPNYSTELTYNPSTGTVTAKKFAGPATSATYDAEGGAIHDKYLKRAGGTMTGALKFADNIYNAFGDDVEIGSQNAAGKLNIHGKNGATGIVFVPYSGSTSQTISIDGAGVMTITGTVKTTLKGNADTATKLKTARNFNITDSSAAYSGPNVSFDGSADITLHMPDTFAGTLKGNSDTATKLKTARTLWGQSFNGTANISGNMTGVGNVTSTKTNTYTLGTSSNLWKAVYATTFYGALSGNASTATTLQTARNLHITDSSATYNGPNASFNGSADITLHMPSTFTGHLKGNADNDGNGVNIASNYMRSEAVTGDIDRMQVVLAGKTGRTGSISLTKKDSGTGSQVPAGWYNYVFSPHRTGIGGDNDSYGTTLIFPMTFSGNSYIVRRSSSKDAATEVKMIIDSGNIGKQSVDNADKVDGYHASSLWRSDGAVWNPGANVSMTGAANGQEWSFDIHKGGMTGLYWQVWEDSKATLLKVDADTGKVSAPYGFVGALTGNASSATKLLTNGTHVEAASNNDTSTWVSKNGMLYTSGMYMTETYNDANTPVNFGNIINLAGRGAGQLLLEWTSGAPATGHIYYRDQRDCAGSGDWHSWQKVAFVTDNVASATKWATARNFQVDLALDNPATVKVDGTKDVILPVTGILATKHGGTGQSSHTANRLVWSETATKLSATNNHYASASQIAVNSTSAPTGYTFLVNGKTHLNGDARVTGNLLMTTGGSSIYWDNGTVQQRIITTDDSTADTAVFAFQQSENSASSWNNLLTIRDNGRIVLQNEKGGIYKLVTTANTSPLIQLVSDNQDVSIFKVASGTSIIDSWSCGFDLIYKGTGAGIDNLLTLYAGDYHNTGTKVIGWSVNQAGQMGIKTTPSSSYSLNINGNTYSNGKFYINNTSDASLTADGAVVIGPTNGENLTLDTNEIMARNNKAASTLYLNRDGGLVQIGSGGLLVNGQVKTTGPLLIGSDVNGRGKNYIAFYGTTSDGAGSFNHTYIGENLYGETESSELVLFKGNDIGGAPEDMRYVNGSGPDRIRHIAAGHLFQAFRTTSAKRSGTFAEVCATADDANLVNVFEVNNKGVVVYGVGTDTQDYPAKITFRVKDTVSSQEYGAYIAVYNDHNTSASNGSNMVINPGGNAFIGSGESPASLYALKKATTTEHLFLTADSTMYLYANAATIANRVGIAINTSGHILPQKAEAAHTNALNIGANNNYFANIYSRWLYANAGGVADDGGISLYSNANTTYFIAMRGTGTATGQLGTHGYVTNDYATYFGMSTNSTSTPNRGWIFRETRTGLNVASISTRGWAQFNGICLNRANDTGSDRNVGSSKIHHGFLSWYGYNWKNWVTYMSDSTNNACPTGGKPSTLGKVTSWALRSVIQNSSGYGWVWEASAITTTAEPDPTTKPTALMSLDSNFGQLRIAQKGTTNANTQTAGLVISSAENGGSADVAIELWRGANASWQMRNSGGVLTLASNYTSSAQGSYSQSSLTLDYNTGAGSIPYLAIGQTARNTSYRLYVNGTSYLGGNTIIKGHLTPDADSTYDVGSTSKHWRYGYFDGMFVSTQTGFTSTIGNAGVAGTFIGTGYMEMVASTPYIDFHQGSSTADFSARIISDGANRLTINQGGTPASLSYNSRSINPLLRVVGTLYASSNIESAEYFLNNRASAGGGFYVYSNNVQQGRLYLKTLGTTNAIGVTELLLGNGTASGTANNSRGRIQMYGRGTTTKMVFEADTHGNIYLYKPDGSKYYSNAAGAQAVNFWHIYTSDQNMYIRTYAGGSATAASAYKYISMFQNGGLGLNTTTQSVTPSGASAITPILRAQGTGYFDGTVWATASFISNNTNVGRGFYVRRSNAQYAAMYIDTAGTAGDGTNAGTTGLGMLVLGNSTAVTATSGSGGNNARGLLRIYGANANYTQIYAQANGNRTIYLPNYAGNMYLVHAGSNSALGGAQQPVYIAANGRATACTSYTDALDGRYVNVSGDTMTGQLLTSFKKSVAMGSYQAAATTVAALVEEVRYSSGCMGSVSLSATYAATAGGTIAAGWYNFIYSPHRSGGANGAASGDNHAFGTLMLMGMTVGSAHWRIRVASGAISEVRRVWNAGDAVTGAVWNDYAECREADITECGYVLTETGKDSLTKTTERLQHFAGVSSDTWGFSQGETEKAKTPIAVAGRVLVYPYQDRDNYQPGDCVCAAPGGTVDIMTREEVIRYPDRIVGTVSCVPNYEEWGGGENADRDPVKVNGRIWIKVR